MSIISVLTLMVCLLFPIDAPKSAALKAPDITTPAPATTASTPAVTQTAATPSPAPQVQVAPVPTPAPAPVPRCNDTASIGTVAIEAICLSEPVQHIGLTANGEIDTPVSNVGLWGVEPGQVGNSLLDGHVFGVFSKLSQVHAGAIISVNVDGTAHSYRVTGTETIALEDLYKNGKWDSILFPSDGQSHLTLITCAGHSLGGAQYSHRFFVYATLMS